MAVGKLVQKSEQHMKYRWVGVPFFACGVVWCVVALTKVSVLGFFPVMISVASMLMGLTCFGLHHDTAIQLGLNIKRVDPEVSLPPIVQREIQLELERDKANALSLKGHPTLAMVLPFIVLVVHALTIYILWF